MRRVSAPAQSLFRSGSCGGCGCFCVCLTAPHVVGLIDLREQCQRDRLIDVAGQRLVESGLIEWHRRVILVTHRAAQRGRGGGRGNSGEDQRGIGVHRVCGIDWRTPSACAMRDASGSSRLAAEKRPPIFFASATRGISHAMRPQSLIFAADRRVLVMRCPGLLWDAAILQKRARVKFACARLRCAFAVSLSSLHRRHSIRALLCGPCRTAEPADRGRHSSSRRPIPPLCSALLRCDSIRSDAHRDARGSLSLDADRPPSLALCCASAAAPLFSLLSARSTNADPRSSFLPVARPRRRGYCAGVPGGFPS